MLTPVELDAHIKTNIWKLYPGEMNESILSLYATINLAIGLGTNKLVIAPTQVTHLDKNDRIVFKLHSDELARELAASQTITATYMEMFELILSRDSLIRDHIELISKTFEQAEYRIKHLCDTAPLR